MRANQKGFSLATAVLGVFVGTAALAGTVVYRYGAVKVTVDEKKPGGDHLRLWAPGAAVPVALKLVPDERLRRVPPEARRWLPVVAAGSEALARCPDGPLVQVESPRERVSIAKRGGALVIEVDTEDETVHVTLPLRVLTAVARELEAANPPG